MKKKNGSITSNLDDQKTVKSTQVDALLTVDEVAQYLRLEPGTIRAMARRGELPAVKVGRMWRFKKSSLIEYLKEGPE
jgi:excisionase family DNA binding protein